MIDLHIHTTASSDGQHSPREIFQMAREKALRAISFTDHNSAASVEEGVRISAEFGIEFIPGIELNTLHRGLDLHLLAYFIDPRSPDLREWLDEIIEKKIEQGQKRLARLNEMGFVFSREDLEKHAKGRIPTGSSFLRAILSREENGGDPRLKPYIDGDRSGSPYVNFYRDYLRGGKPAFVPMEDVATIPAVERIRRIGAVPVLAHPSDTPEEVMIELVENGLAGLEVYSPYHNAEERESFRKFAESRGLVITAGSDFHGRQIKPDVQLGAVFGDHSDLLPKLKKARKDQE